jgi:aryl-alcohol dehydrogenase-like predicted oxidoreductase
MGTWKTFDVQGAKVEADRAELVRRGVDLGLNLVDSSPMYGESERVLGKAVATYRDQVVVATKVWSDDDHVAKRQIDDSIAFFGGRVDLFQVHNLVAARRRLDQLRALQAQGKVGAIGITHWSEAMYGRMSELLPEVDTIQIPYNPIQAAAAESLLDRAAELDVGVIVMRPFGEGSLLRRSPSPRELEPLLDFGVRSWAQALLKWGLSDSRCHVAIPATTSLEHLRENLTAATAPWFGARERDLVSRLAGR